MNQLDLKLDIAIQFFHFLLIMCISIGILLKVKIQWESIEIIFR